MFMLLLPVLCMPVRWKSETKHIFFTLTFFFKINWTHTHMCAHTLTHTHVSHGNGTEEKVTDAEIFAAQYSCIIIQISPTKS